MWTRTEQAHFIRRLAAAAEVLGEPVTPARLAGYAALLADLPADDVVRGLESAVQRAEFFPKPVHIRREAEGLAAHRLRIARDTGGQTRQALPSPPAVPIDPSPPAPGPYRDRLIEWISEMRNTHQIGSPHDVE